MAKTFQLLEVKDLNTSFKIDAGRVLAVNGVYFKLKAGEVLGIVGESGSGKSVTAYSIMRILDKNGAIDTSRGRVYYNGTDLLKLTEKEMRHIRGNRISIIFQDAMTSLNPTWSIGNQLREAILIHAKNPIEQALYDIENAIRSDEQRIVAMKRGIRNHPEREQTKIDLAEIEQKLIDDKKLLVEKRAEAIGAYRKLKKEKDREFRKGVPSYNKALRASIFTYLKKFFDLAPAPSVEEGLAQKEAKALAAAIRIAQEQCAIQEKKVEVLLAKDVSSFSKEEKEVYSLTLKNEKTLLLTAKKDLSDAKKKLRKYVSSYRRRVHLTPRRERFVDIKKALRARLDYRDSVVSAYKETKHSAHRKALKMLEEVGITEPEKRMKQYPFELSGGMMQRCMIAMALVERPDILIADEPTTALDVTIQAQILDLLKRLQKEYGMAIIIITHDLGVVAQICDKVNIMYAGRIVERGTVEDIFYNPQHEYTKGLLKSMPKLNQNGEKLEPIAGNPVDLFCLPKGCAFSSRCRKCMEICIEKYPAEVTCNENGHAAACWRMIKELHDKGEIDVVNGTPEGKPFVYNGAVIAETKKVRGRHHGKR